MQKHWKYVNFQAFNFLIHELVEHFLRCESTTHVLVFSESADDDDDSEEEPPMPTTPPPREYPG